MTEKEMARFSRSGAADSQYGVALVTALLVVAMVSIAAVAMVTRQQFDIRRTANVIDADSAYLFNLGIEAWAVQVLARDRLENQIDTTNEDWASILPPLTVEGASVAGKIDDLEGRLNLNNLVNGDAPSDLDIERFRRILELLDIEPDLADAVIDWIDPDTETRFPGGAEDSEYLGYEPPYRAANTMMTSISELRLVKGVTQEIYDKLSPFISTLPTRTSININTAPAMVLRSLAENITEADSEELVDGRGEKGYQSVAEFLAQPIPKERAIAKQGLGVASRYFLVLGHSKIGYGRIDLYSLLERANNGKVTVLRRGLGAI